MSFNHNLSSVKDLYYSSKENQWYGMFEKEIFDRMDILLCVIRMPTEKFNPDRIIVEASGSAFPAPIAWQIRQMKDQGFVLDGIVTVIDCVNFRGYEDTSYTAKMQAKYTDITLLNKHELVLKLFLIHLEDLLSTGSFFILLFEKGHGVSDRRCPGPRVWTESRCTSDSLQWTAWG